MNNLDICRKIFTNVVFIEERRLFKFSEKTQCDFIYLNKSEFYRNEPRAGQCSKQRSPCVIYIEVQKKKRFISGFISNRPELFPGLFKKRPFYSLKTP